MPTVIVDAALKAIGQSVESFFLLGAQHSLVLENSFLLLLLGELFVELHLLSVQLLLLLLLLPLGLVFVNLTELQLRIHVELLLVSLDFGRQIVSLLLVLQSLDQQVLRAHGLTVDRLSVDKGILAAHGVKRTIHGVALFVNTPARGC